MSKKGDEETDDLPVVRAQTPPPPTNGRVTLAAIDFLGLAEEKKVARVDLAKFGRKGIVHVCDLSTTEQSEIFKPRGKQRRDKHGNTEVDWKDMPLDFGIRILEKCMVTDGRNGEDIEALFQAAAEAQQTTIEQIPHIFMAEGTFQYMNDLWLKGSSIKEVRTRLGKMGNEIVSAISDVVSEISGINKDEEADPVEEAKKD